jgi:hypothetical protein
MSALAINQASNNEESKQDLVVKPTLTDSLKLDFKMSSKTSIFRSGASAPVKVLLEKNILSVGSALNYGKGKFDHDTDEIRKITTHCVGYDYTYHPDTELLLGSSYNTVYCGYVVNTLPIDARKFVWCQMAECTANKGIAFVAARTDKSNINGVIFEDGVITKIGTFQKFYDKGTLVEEAKQFFKYVVEIKGKSGFSLVACSNIPLPKKITVHQK